MARNVEGLPFDSELGVDHDCWPALHLWMYLPQRILDAPFLAQIIAPMVRTYKPVTPTARRCAICGRSFVAKRRDAKLCGYGCRHKSSRYVTHDTAHQHRARGPHVDPPDTLTDCTFSEVARADAVPVLTRYEWLGDEGKADRFFASYTPDGRVMSVTGFTIAAHRLSDAGRTVALVRGCTTPAAHQHAPTWTIARALRVLRSEGAQRVIAYSDTLAGERGVIYSACGFQRVNAPHDRWRVRPPGVKWHEHHKCHSDRWLRHGGRNWTVAQARAKGYRVERIPQRIRWERDL